MFLFLDVISPLPEFFIIEDNKLIYHRKIIKNDSEKLSDNIIEAYSAIDKDLKLTKNLKKIAMTIGPGSYTSLRVGAAFLSGLIISKNLLFSPITINDFFNFTSNSFSLEKAGFFLSSANNQNFFCTLDSNKKLKYQKIEKDDYIVNKNIQTIFYNLRQFKHKYNNIKQYKISFIEQLLENNNLLIFKNKINIKPIYTSNNKILN